MTTKLARVLAALALTIAMGFGYFSATVVMAQDEVATEVDEAADTAEDEANQVAEEVTDEDDGFDDWGLIGLLGLAGLAGLLRRPERNVVVDDTTRGTRPPR